MSEGRKELNSELMFSFSGGCCMAADEPVPAELFDSWNRSGYGQDEAAIETIQG